MWPWLWPLEWATVKCKYTIRKPISNFLHVGNSNICCINHVNSTEIVSIRIFYLQKVGHGHELRCQICSWMAFFVSYKMVKKWLFYLKPFSTDSPTRHTHTCGHTHNTHADYTNRRMQRVAYSLKISLRSVVIVFNESSFLF